MRAIDGPGHGQSVSESVLALAGVRRGKVRDVYPLPEDATVPAGVGARLLLVATDRISAFDVVMPTPIAGKGRLLTRLSTFWLRFIEERGLCKTHLLSTDAGALADRCFVTGGTTREQLEGRITIARAARVIPIECVVRGYLEGSGWKEYRTSGSVCGVALPAGLEQCARLPEPIFTPATKEEMGKHDENVSFERASRLVGEGVMRRLRETSLAIYREAAAYALSRGIIIADTKFEFGVPVDGSGDGPILIDEALTPDSSRFWPVEGYRAGAAQRSFDKQYLREYLESLVAAGKWDKQPPGPELPESVVRATQKKYGEACDRLVG
jgi:phosphoribosylaminoimidazole-succinocarboxamide synthase